MFRSTSPGWLKNDDVRSFDCPHLDDHGELDKGSIAVVGIGNPLRTDDSIGPLLVKSLPTVNLKACRLVLESFTVFLADIVESHTDVVVVDSVAPENKNQSVYAIHLDRETIDSFPCKVSTSHGVSWLDEVKLLCQTKYAGGLPASLHFFGVSAAGDGSPGVSYSVAENALERLVELVIELGGRRQ